MCQFEKLYMCSVIQFFSWSAKSDLVAMPWIRGLQPWSSGTPCPTCFTCFPAPTHMIQMNGSLSKPDNEHSFESGVLEQGHIWNMHGRGSLRNRVEDLCPRCHLNEGFYIVLLIAFWSKYLWDWSLLCYYYPYIVSIHPYMTIIWSAVFPNVKGYFSHFEFPVMAIGKQLASVSKDNLPFDQSCSRH